MKVRRVPNGAVKFHGTSRNILKSLLTGPDLLHNLIHVLLGFLQHQFAMSADSEGMFLQVGVPYRDQTSHHCVFLAGGPQNECCSVSIHAPCFGDSPTCAKYALQRKARENTSQYTESTKSRPKNLLLRRLARIGGVLRDGSHIDRKNWCIFSILVGSSSLNF